MKEKQFKLNIFALPNQTTILFGLMVFVLIGIFIVGSLSEVRLLVFFPFTALLLILPIRAFLARPQRNIRTRQLRPAPDSFQPLQDTIVELAQEMGLRHRPQLLLGQVERTFWHELVSKMSRFLPVAIVDWLQRRLPQDQSIHTFGSRRNWYVAMTLGEAKKMQADLIQQTAVTRAILIHELHHFQGGDYWRLGYLAELFQQTRWLLGWAILFSMGWGVLLVMAANEFFTLNIVDFLNEMSEPFQLGEDLAALLPPQAELDALAAQVQSINLIESTFFTVTFFFVVFMPFVVVTFLLRFFLWPKLWRTQEFYADAKVVHRQKRSAPFHAALTGMLLAVLPQSLPLPAPKTQAPWPLFKGWLHRFRHYHSPLEVRLQAIHSPETIFSSWLKTAVLSAVLAFLVDMLFQTPLTFFFVNETTVHYTTVMIFVVTALYLIPVLVQRGNVIETKVDTNPIWKITAVSVAIKALPIISIVVFVAIAFLISPTALDARITQMVVILSGQTALSPQDFLFGNDLSGFVADLIFSAIAQIVIAFVTLFLSLWGAWWLIGRLLQWYALPQAEKRLMRIAYGIIVTLTIFLVFTFLPLVTTLIMNPAELPNRPFLWLSAVTGLIIFIVGIAAFFYFARQYRNRCPHCQQSVPPPYELGKCCPHCQQRLQPWFLVEYEV